MDPMFRAWWRKVDGNVMSVAGVSILDLPDAPYRDWFDDGLKPSEAAELVLMEAGWTN